MEPRVKRQIAYVKQALAELVDKGLVLEYEAADGQVHYRINRRKQGEIQSQLKEWANNIRFG
ncbi:MAG: hypothetical protein ACFFCW_37065 [Candidatus Hodarchaeota archaeon]